jgi:hypothetical protein
MEAGKTLYYGLVPTVSSELSEADPVFAADDSFSPDSRAFRDHLVDALRGNLMEFPFAGEAAQGWWFGALESVGAEPPRGVDAQNGQFKALKNTASVDNGRMRRFLMLLRQLAVEFNAFDGGAEVADLKKVLHEVQLPLTQRPGETVQLQVRADDFLALASQLLLSNQALPDPLEMPLRWPALDGDLKRRLASALHGTLLPRFKALKGRAGRFDEPGARYTLQAFLRLKPEGHCPERIIWSEPSDAFVIAPWYEGAGAPPVQIPLPDPSDRELLKSLKPNIAFVVPPSIQNLLSGSTKDLMEGKGDMGSGLGITWICGFSIPIITICAFIVLNIFLTLFNIVFGWMLFLKICLPLPKFGSKPPGG